MIGVPVREIRECLDTERALHKQHDALICRALFLFIGSACVRPIWYKVPDLKNEPYCFWHTDKTVCQLLRIAVP